MVAMRSGLSDGEKSKGLSGLFARLGPRRAPGQSGEAGEVDAPDLILPTKALKKFLVSLRSHDAPVLLDLGPVVGSNVAFFGEQLGCKIFIEDLFADLDRHVRQGAGDALAEFFAKRFRQEDESVDGILCWDLIDYLDRPAGQALASELTRLLRPEGALLAFFSSVETHDPRYTKFVVVDDEKLAHRPYAAARPRQRILLNRDIIRLFERLRVSDSFLLKTNMREILFRKPAVPRPV